MVLNFALWLFVGLVSGWVSGRLLKTNAHIDTSFNLFAGVCGGLAGGAIVGPVFGFSRLDEAGPSLPAFMGALMGAAMALALAQVLRRSHLR